MSMPYKVLTELAITGGGSKAKVAYNEICVKRFVTCMIRLYPFHHDLGMTKQRMFHLNKTRNIEYNSSKPTSYMYCSLTTLLIHNYGS